MFQARTIAHYLCVLAQQTAHGKIPFLNLTHQLEQSMSLEQGMPTSLDGGDLVAVRRFEVAAAVSRLRGLVATWDSKEGVQCCRGCTCSQRHRLTFLTTGGRS